MASDGSHYGCSRGHFPLGHRRRVLAYRRAGHGSHVFDLLCCSHAGIARQRDRHPCNAHDLLHTDRFKWSLRFTAVNLTDKAALYNFLSTFSGTHFVTPRTETVELGFHF
jgi:hypothetical protein